MSHLSLVIKLSLDPENESEAELRGRYTREIKLLQGSHFHLRSSLFSA